MKIAIFSDVHGNLTALEAVLADIKQHSPDLVIFAGDLCTDGARPAECMKRLRSESISSIHGNTDLELSNQPLLSRDVNIEETFREMQIRDNVDWTWAQLSEEERAWLRTLPFHRRVSPTSHPKDDLFIVHANPKDVNRHILPPESMQDDLYGEVRQPDDAPELKEMLDELRGMVAFGHLHIPSVRHWGDVTLVNISSVSLPLDGDQRAKYGLLTWNDGWDIEHRHIDYDVDKEIEVLKTRKPPTWKELVERLKSARQT